VGKAKRGERRKVEQTTNAKHNSRADFPALDGPIIKILRTGRASSDDDIAETMTRGGDGSSSSRSSKILYMSSYLLFFSPISMGWSS